MQPFTLRELAMYDGKNGAPAYFAFQGYVYDASGSFLWRNGRHQARHMAGTDLTDALDQAPHGTDLIERLPRIGILVQE